MSFGLSIGDFLAVLELGNKIRKEFAGAPSQFRHLSDELRSLTIIVQDIDVLIAESELDAQQVKDLEAIADGCHRVLSDLNETLNKHSELQNSGGNVGLRIKRVWKKLKWEPEDICVLRNRITSNIILLHAYIGRISSGTTLATKKVIDRIDQRQCDQERLAILNWLTPIDYASEQSDFIKRRQAGTGQLLLESSEFQTWLCSDRQTLFCLGIPGAGKTILASIVIDTLTTRFKDDENIGVAYVYCSFRRQAEQNAEDLLMSLLKQLAQGRSVLPVDVKSLFDRHRNKRTRPAFHEISQALRSVLNIFSKVWIVLDALDECSCRSRFLADVMDLKIIFGVKIFATSRFISEIVNTFENSISLKIRASPEDIHKYIDGHIPQLPSFVSRSPPLQEELKNGIVRAVDGMFLLAQLHLQSLIGKRSPKALRTALAKLHTGTEAYNHAYEDAMQRIKGQVYEQTELAKQVLCWITCARRPLTILELQHALAVEPCESDIDEENISQIEDIVSVCAGLVTVDDKSKVIRLVHYTAQQYFEQNRRKWFPNAEIDITTSSLAYLSFGAFETGYCRTKVEYDDRLKSYPLYDHTARNWGHHAREVVNSPQTMLNQTIIKFLASKFKLHASSQAILTNQHDIGRPNFPKYTMALHIAAYFGLENPFYVFLNGTYPPDVRDANGRTPLSWAAERGNDVIVKYLLATGKVDVNSKESAYGRTPMIFAAKNGHLSVVKLLTSHGADMETRDSAFNSTPILSAAWMGHTEVVRLLLDQGAELDPRNFFDSTPLSLAVENQHSEVVKLLLESGANTHLSDKDCRTPLSYAAENLYEDIVEMLLKADGVDIEAGDGNSRTPLLYAAMAGSVSIVNSLLEAGANINSEDRWGLTPLAWAVAEGEEAIVKLLLSKGDIGINWKHPSGDTLVSLARQKGHENIVQLLLVATEARLAIHGGADTSTPSDTVTPADKTTLDIPSNQFPALPHDEMLSDLLALKKHLYRLHLKAERAKNVQDSTVDNLRTRLFYTLSRRRYLSLWDPSYLGEFRQAATSFLAVYGCTTTSEIGSGSIEVLTSNPIIKYEDYKFQKFL